MNMMLNEGDKVLVVHRRLYERDEPRFFVGRVDAFENGIVKVTGHSYVRDMMSGRMVEKMESRTKILSLTSGTLIIYQLHQDVALDSVQFTSDDGCVSMSDRNRFTMNLSEYAHSGKV
jgi:hypothetical protein